jgi:hypothetical protein
MVSPLGIKNVKYIRKSIKQRLLASVGLESYRAKQGLDLSLLVLIED